MIHLVPPTSTSIQRSLSHGPHCFLAMRIPQGIVDVHIVVCSMIMSNVTQIFKTHQIKLCDHLAPIDLTFSHLFQEMIKSLNLGIVEENLKNSTQFNVLEKMTR